MRGVSPWNADALLKARADHVRRARNAKAFADATEGATRKVWRDHCRDHVRRARAENRALVMRLRQWSASMFFRKTIGADMRAVPQGGARCAA